ncbi:flagellar hook-basal body complex protein [Planococcus salinus]|uniref:Flagellar hook protein FlgE n=1 Tax=Planococcus salinus TaxID=1848460 RepID=A0A3M8P638_9BACL|nr:flagellar hook-basal body complex protein [Planococcus salinus]RNF38750.1 flagellar hook-basal body complex protein [Planococcus salinus]
MLRSMYAGVSGMKNFQTKLDVIGNNIANVNTIGFKKSTINFQEMLSQNISDSGTNPMQVGLGSTTAAVNVQHTPGSMMSTGIGTNLSIMGNGFFVVQDPDVAEETGVAGGEGQFLTRSGNFTVNADGNLVTAQGYNVLDSEGRKINIDSNEYDSFAITRDGRLIGKPSDGGEDVSILGDRTVGIVIPENPSGLRKFGGSLYELTGQANAGALNIGTVADAKTEVGSGQLEMSNVDLTEEFTEMIVAQRGFQANSRIISTSDEILQEVVNLKR